MTLRRDSEIERICQGALERPARERDRFVSEACGDDTQLLREVEQLLAHASAASGFLEPPAAILAVSGPGATGPVLSPGQRLGAYTIVSRLGAGGMGEVYRARDTTLGRDVAIKVLPSIFTSNVDRLARFEREARALATLNHPNIATIHGVERADGVHAIVLEVVEGDTLTDVIASRPLPLERALTIARQIADALEAAHDKGIIHRDLKPANIKIRPDGVVKVLDFGLAKLVTPHGGSAEHDLPYAASRSPTLTATGIQGGALLGTAAYMSPEQARGQAVDKRTDIWAFGCVLYEMLTGRTAFARENVTDTLAAIVGQEPDWTAIPASAPANISRLLQRCLRKDPARRLHDIADARIEIDETPIVLGTVDSTSTTRSRFVWIAAAGALAAGAAIGALVLPPLSQPAQEVRLEINTPPTVDPISLAISPDGRALTFVAMLDGLSQLWVRNLDDGSARPLARTDNASSPFWSPDNRSIGFFADRQIKRVDLDSGSVRVVTPLNNVMLGAAWSVDGTILFNRGTGASLWRVPADGGEARPVTETGTDRINRFHRSPQFLPDSHRFLFRVVGPAGGIYVGDLGSSDAPRRILEAPEAVYAASGHLLFIRDGTLLAQAFDLSTAQLSGSPIAVAEDVLVGEQGAALSASAAGPIVFRTGSFSPATEFVWFDRTGRALGTVAGSRGGSSYRSALSRDGKYLAFTRTPTGGGGYDIWIVDIGRGTPSRLTSDAGFELAPVWSPDSNRIAYYREGETIDLVVSPFGRTGPVEVLFKGERTRSASGNVGSCWPEDWSRDGVILCDRSFGDNQRFDLWALPATGDRAPFPIVETEFAEFGGQFSPDGRWVAYHANDSGSYEIYVSPFPGPGRRMPVSSGGGVQARWSNDGKELYYLGPGNRLTAVSVRPATTPTELQFDTPVPLFQTHLTGNIVNGRHYHVSGDGRFLVDTLQEVTSPVTILLNWKPGPADGKPR